MQTLDAYLRRLGWRWLAVPAALVVLLSALALKDVHEHQSAQLDAVARGLAEAVASAVTQAQAMPTLADWYVHLRGYDLTFDTPVALAYPDRRMLLNTHVPLGTDLPSLPKPPQRQAFDDALASGQLQFGDMVWGPVLKANLVQVIVPVTAGGQTFGLLGLIPVPKFQALLVQERIPAGWTAVLRDTAGQRVASIDGEALRADAGPIPATRRVIKSQVAAWTVVVQADPWSFYAPHLRLAAGLALGLALAFAGAAMAARRARRGLVSAARHLVPGGAAADWPSSPLQDPQVPRIAKIEQARAELARASLARASLARLEAADAERERVARDLHDGLQQRAAAIKLRLDIALQGMPPGADRSGLVRDAADQIDGFISEIDHTVRRMRPSSLEQLGLCGAMKQLMAQSSDTAGFQGEVEFVGDEAAADALPAAQAECLYRVLQESLNNVRKHARAGFVHAVLDLSSPAQVTLTVSDDGVGIDENHHPAQPGFGLRGMWQRVQLLDGRLQVRRGHHADPTHGTTVQVQLPLAAVTIAPP